MIGPHPIFALLLLFLVSCGTAPRESNPQPILLSEFLSIPYPERLDAALERGDSRYLLIHGSVDMVPCVPTEIYNMVMIRDYRFWRLTLSDFRIGETADTHEFLDLYQNLILYACSYNQALFDHLNGGSSN